MRMTLATALAVIGKEGAALADLSEVDAPVHIGHRGLVCHVNDHGNATLYAMKANGTLREIWSVV